MSSAMAIVLAAGKSTRMKSAWPKVVHEVCGRPMVDYVLDSAREAGVTRIVVIVGHRADLVQQTLRGQRDLEFVLQSEQKGTGHAIMMCRDALASHAGPVLILAGDTPLLRSESLKMLLSVQAEAGAAAVIGSARTPANQGLGRVVRSSNGAFQRIVEEKDANAEQKMIQEINTGCYAFDSQLLLSTLDQLKPNNAQGEYYLTDCPRLLMDAGKTVMAKDCFTAIEAMGVNTRVQLAEVTKSIQAATHERLMLSGVTIVNPDLTMIDPRAQIEPDTIIEPFTQISGRVHIGSGSRIGPHAVIRGDVQLGPSSVVSPFEKIG